MKNRLKTLKIVMAVALTIFVIENAFVQVQMQKWYLKSHEIDFNNTTPVVSPQATVSGEYGVGFGEYDSYDVGNALHDPMGAKHISVYNNHVTCSNGLSFDLPGTSAWGNPEFGDMGADIIPKPGDKCSYYIVYSFGRQSCNSCPVGYCGYNTNNLPKSGYTRLYVEVNLAANGGQGSYTTTPQEIVACQPTLKPIPAAVSPLIGDIRYYYIFTNGSIQKFIISDNGINFDNTIYQNDTLLNAPGFGNYFTAAELELSHDGTMLSMADMNSNRVIVFHLNPSTGELASTAGTNNDGTSFYDIPNVSQLTGIEFSPNSNNLFVAARNTGVYQIDLVNETIEGLITGSEDYGNSMMELAFHPDGLYKIYVANDDGTSLGEINDVDDSDPGFTANAIQNITLYENSSFLSSNTVWHLPRQIDGQDYENLYFDPGSSSLSIECCLFLSGSDIRTYSASSNMTWTETSNPFNNQNEVLVEEEIRILSGNHVTINNMTFRFRENAKLVVESGAKLTLVNSTLTSYECDIMWLGVELQGTMAAPQQTNNQGWLIMHNSEISNARNGVSVYRKNQNNSVVWNTFGGVVQAHNSTFRNNIRDVEFLAYIRPNKSYFSNCVFITDAALNNGAPPLVHVTMWATSDIKFSGCDFKNTTSGLYPKNSRGKGIQSIDASYLVTYRCNVPQTTGQPCTNMDRGSFEGLVMGIDAVATSISPRIEVLFNDFVNNGRGIYTGGMNNAVIVENTFEMDNPTGWNLLNVYGLYMENCSGYTVQNNQFFNVEDGWTVGSVVNNSNTGVNEIAANEIYNNYYEGFLLGAGAINSNAYILNLQIGPWNFAIPYTGLVHRCNDFEETQGADLYNTGPVPPQGTCIPTLPMSPANNLFSTEEPIFDLYNFSAYNVNYRYSESNTFITAPRTDLYLPTNTFPYECTGMTFSTNNSCPKRSYETIIYATKFQNGEIDEDLTAAEALVALIDGGDSDKLYDLIGLGDGNSMADQIHLSAPYVSEPMLIYLINNAHLYDDSLVFAMLQLNAPLSANTIDSLDRSSLPQYIREYFKISDGLSPFYKLLSDAAYYQSSAYIKTMETLRAIEQDSTVSNPYSEILEFLDNNNVLNKKDFLLSYAYQYGDSALVDSLISNYVLGTSDDDYYNLFELKLQLESDSLGLYLAGNDSLKLAEVLEFLDGVESNYVSTVLQKVLSIISDYEYKEEVPYPSLSRMMMQTPPNQANKTLLLLFPNPVENTLNVSIELKDGEMAVCEFYNVSGMLVHSDELRFRRYSTDLSHLQTGVYLVRIAMPDGSVHLGKIVKN